MHAGWFGRIGARRQAASVPVLTTGHANGDLGPTSVRPRRLSRDALCDDELSGHFVPRENASLALAAGGTTLAMSLGMLDTNRTSRVVDKSGRIEIVCARRLSRDRVELSVDGEDAALFLRLRVYDPERAVVCERLVRSLPATVAFLARVAGLYQVDVTPLATESARPTRTWSDWKRDVSGAASASISVSTQDGCGEATIEVA
jgi:hypothetical protein